MTGSGSDDPLATALIDGSAYERVRVQRMSTFDQRIPRKLHRFGWLLYLLAAALLSLAVLPPATEAVLPVDPLANSTKVLVLGLIGGSVVVAMGVALILNALAAVRLTPMDESTAESLLALEEMASQKGREEVEQELQEMRESGASQREIEETREEYAEDDSIDYDAEDTDDTEADTETADADAERN